jgi:hypothetical protein
MKRAKFYRLADSECDIINGLLEQYKQNLQEMKDVLLKIHSLRILSDEEVRKYNELTDEIVKINSIQNRLTVY